MNITTALPKQMKHELKSNINDLPNYRELPTINFTICG